MAPDRITNAIDSLITHIVPSDPNDPDEVAQERHDTCFEIVKSIIDRYASPSIKDLLVDTSN
jgi:gamma-tubulin complex component 3